MQKVVLIPDSFKGTLSSAQICEQMAACIHRRFPECQVLSIPVADGGEGTVDAFLAAAGGEKVLTVTEGPLGEAVESYFGLLRGGTAVVEMAACAGLPLMEEHKDPMRASTFGVGQQLLTAARMGVHKIILGLGGSATNDGGCGAAAACGVKFYNTIGNVFVPTGGTLKEIERIDASGLDPLLRDVELTAMCDIDNPMFGLHGAAYVFGPQKGADEVMVRVLDEGLRHLYQVICRDLDYDCAALPGGGAAGAMGAGMVAFFGAGLQMGIETVLDTVDFDTIIRDADWIFTGEGKLDKQSLRGKVVCGVARRAAAQNKPVIAVVGGSDAKLESVYACGVTAVFPINRLPQDLSVSRYHTAENLVFTMENILRLL